MSTIYSPHITYPTDKTNFNEGVVEIQWTIKSLTDTASVPLEKVVFELQYTDYYDGSKTNWFTIDSRIPYSATKYFWTAGKSIKSASVRVRMRTKVIDSDVVSEWSISEHFAVNVFALISPAIVNPVPNFTYSDSMLIVLDEGQLIDTYNQKIRYYIDYSSDKLGINWTKIASNLVIGQNVIKWNIDGLSSSDDYILRLTTKNSSTCYQATPSEPDQISIKYIHNIIVKQIGVFLIDTRPPKAIIEIDNTQYYTNQREQIINIFAEDDTSDVEQIQLRECDASSVLSLGDIEDPYLPDGGCKSVAELVQTNSDLLKLIGKPINNSTKVVWTFEDSSGLKKIEALITDTGGNSSLQEIAQVFVPVFATPDTINDFIVVLEQRDKIEIDDETTPPSVTVTPSIFEVVYAGTSNGNLWVLEPFSRLLYTIDNQSITKLVEFNDSIYILTTSADGETSYLYLNSNTEATLIYTFNAAVSSCAVFNSSLYIGLKNGELWKYNKSSVTEISIPTTDPISAMSADDSFLCIGFYNSRNFLLYNNTFSELILD